MTAIPKNVYIDKLDDIVNECSNIYHRTIKMKPIDVKTTYIDFEVVNNDKDPKFELVTMQEYQIIKIFLQKLPPKLFRRGF